MGAPAKGVVLERADLAAWGQAAERIRELMEKDGSEDTATLQEKIDLLENWQKRASKALPLILKLIGG